MRVGRKLSSVLSIANFYFSRSRLKSRNFQDFGGNNIGRNLLITKFRVEMCRRYRHVFGPPKGRSYRLTVFVRPFVS